MVFAALLAVFSHIRFVDSDKDKFVTGAEVRLSTQHEADVGLAEPLYHTILRVAIHASGDLQHLHNTPEAHNASRSRQTQLTSSVQKLTYTLGRFPPNYNALRVWDTALLPGPKAPHVPAHAPQGCI